MCKPDVVLIPCKLRKSSPLWFHPSSHNTKNHRPSEHQGMPIQPPHLRIRLHHRRLRAGGRVPESDCPWHHGFFGRQFTAEEPRSFIYTDWCQGSCLICHSMFSVLSRKWALLHTQWCTIRLCTLCEDMKIVGSWGAWIPRTSLMDRPA